MSILLALLLQAAAAAPAPDAAMAEARANRALMKSPPTLKSGGDPPFPESERAQGHHGVVVIYGVVGADGRYRDPVVRDSSGAASLDAVALAAARGVVFNPARDGEGKPIAVPVAMPFEFYAYKSTLPGGGMIRYGCGQFVADMDWWRSAHPGAPWSDHELNAMMRGLNVIRQGMMTADSLKQFNSRFDAHWTDTIEQCRKRPGSLLVDVMEPEGVMAKALSKAKR